MFRRGFDGPSVPDFRTTVKAVEVLQRRGCAATNARKLSTRFDEEPSFFRPAGCHFTPLRFSRPWLVLATLIAHSFVKTATVRFSKRLVAVIKLALLAALSAILLCGLAANAVRLAVR